MSNRIAECFLRVANGDRDAHGETALSSAAEGAVADDLRGKFHIRVGEDDDVVFRAALALHAFAAGG